MDEIDRDDSNPRIKVARDLKRAIIRILGDLSDQVASGTVTDLASAALRTYFSLHNIGKEEVEIDGQKFFQLPHLPPVLQAFANLAMAYRNLYQGQGGSRKSEADGFLRGVFAEVRASLVPGWAGDSNTAMLGVSGIESLMAIAQDIAGFIDVAVEPLVTSGEGKIAAHVLTRFQNLMDKDNMDIRLSPMEHPPGRVLPIPYQNDAAAEIRDAASRHKVELPLGDFQSRIGEQAGVFSALLARLEGAIVGPREAFDAIHADLQKSLSQIEILLGRASAFSQLSVTSAGKSEPPMDYFARMTAQAQTAVFQHRQHYFHATARRLFKRIADIKAHLAGEHADALSDIDAGMKELAALAEKSPELRYKAVDGDDLSVEGIELAAQQALASLQEANSATRMSVLLHRISLLKRSIQRYCDLMIGAAGKDDFEEKLRDYREKAAAKVQEMRLAIAEASRSAASQRGSFSALESNAAECEKSITNMVKMASKEDVNIKLSHVTDRILKSLQVDEPLEPLKADLQTFFGLLQQTKKQLELSFAEDPARGPEALRFFIPRTRLLPFPELHIENILHAMVAEIETCFNEKMGRLQVISRAWTAAINSDRSPLKYKNPTERMNTLEALIKEFLTSLRTLVKPKAPSS